VLAQIAQVAYANGMSNSIALRSSTSARTSSQLTTLVRNVAQLRSQLNDAKRMVRLVSDTVTQVEVELKNNENRLAELTHERAGDTPASTVSGLGAAALRGQEAVARWIEEGTLMASADFAQSWGISRQALDQAVERGELFSARVAAFGPADSRPCMQGPGRGRRGREARFLAA